MKKVNVEKWFRYEDSNKLEEQVKYFIAFTIESGLNSYYDGCATEPITKEQWKEYVWREIAYLRGMLVNGNEFNHLKFYGKERLLQLVDIYLDNYSDIQPYIKR